MSDRDPIQSLWKSQQEEFTMSLADVHARSKRFQSAIKRRNWTEYAASAFVIAAFSYLAVTIPNPIVQTGCVLIVMGALYVTWKLSTLARAGSAQDKDAGQSWVEFHRAELVRQRDALRNVWRWYLGPFVPGMLVFMGGVAFTRELEAPLAAKIVIFVLGMAVVGAAFGAIGWLNAYAARRLDREIEALDRARMD